MSESLDPIDGAIVAALARDARISYARIGAQVNLSAPAVKRRVDRLRADGVITGFTVRLDPALGDGGVEAYVEVFCQASTSPATMRDAFAGYREVTAASTVAGAADALLHVRARDVAHLDEVVERVNAETFVERTRSSVVLTPLVRHEAR